MLADIAGELQEASLDAGDEVAQEANGIFEDALDHLPAFFQHGGEHVFELADGLDDTFHQVQGFVHQPLVGRFQFVNAGVQRLQIFLVFVGQGVDELRLFLVDAVFELVEPAAVSRRSGGRRAPSSTQ